MPIDQVIFTWSLGFKITLFAYSMVKIMTEGSAVVVLARYLPRTLPQLSNCQGMNGQETSSGCPEGEAWHFLFLSERS